MDGFHTTPEQLTAAGNSIDSTINGGDVAVAPTLAPGAVYGHAGMADAVSAFASALGIAVPVLTSEAKNCAEGLRASARDYARTEQRNAGELAAGGPR